MIRSQLSRLNLVVLAAGFSVRLGQPKTLARVHGLTLLRRTLSVLVQVTAQPVFVVAPPRASRLRAEIRGCRVVILSNVARAGGLSTSVVRALRSTHCSAATLFLPADLPHLIPRDIERLIACWRGHPRRVVARSMAGRASTPLILPAFLYPQARQLSGDVGLRDFIATLPAEHRLLLDLPSAEFDIDTPQDLAEARRRPAAARACNRRC